MAPQHSSKKRKRVTDIEALPWTMGDDGIEEVEGVEVVRKGDQVEFLVSNTAKRAKTDDATDDGMAEAEEWGGIEGEDDDDDDDKDKTESTNPDADANDVEQTEAAPDKPSKKAEKKKERAEKLKAAKKEKKEKAKAKAKAKAQATQESDPAAGFAALEALEDGERDPDVDMSAWLPLSLSPDMVAALARLKFASPTPIQSASIPEILEGKDVIGKASTGSGKTLAFAIPVVERWLELREEKNKAEADGNNEKVGERSDDEEKEEEEDDDDDDKEGETEAHIPIALVLSPTRELAHQITKHIIALVETMPNPPRVCTVTGGLSIYKQQRQLAKADIVVGTPGRLWEVLGDNGDNGRLLEAFKKIRFLVVDEADRLLSEGHFKEAEEIIAALDKVTVDEEDEAPEGDDDDEGEEGTTTRRPERQTLVFSATFNKNLQQKLAGKGIKYDLMDDKQSMEYLLKKLNFREERPRFIDVNPVSQMADGLREGLIECGAMEKDLYLYAAILLSNCKRTLVFTNSITAVRRLTPMLQLLQIPAQPLHSQMAQKARLRSLEKFKEAKDSQQPNSQKPNAAPKLKRPPVPSVLVATDVAARGLDIPNVDAVIHYHVPRAADAYVHRSGRTARGSNSGLSILLCAPEEVIPTRRLAAKVHAQKAAASAKKAGYMLHTIDVDRRLAGRLKERVTLAKKIADADLAKEKGHKEDGWMQSAADELGVDLDEIDAKGMGKLGWTGRGGGRKKKEAEARELSKAEIGAMRAKLKDALSKRVNAGVSERYVTGGAVDVAELLRDGLNGGLFLGKVDGLEI